MEYISRFRVMDRATFLDDGVVQGAAIHYLVVAIEAITDIGNHFLAGLYQKSAETYEDVLVGLRSQKVITKDLYDRSRGMTRFRNLAVHQYVDVDPGRVHDYLQQAPKQFLGYLKAFERLMKKNKI